MKFPPYLLSVCAAWCSFSGVQTAAQAGPLDTGLCTVGTRLDSALQTVAGAVLAAATPALDLEAPRPSSSGLGGEWMEDFEVAKACQ
jgi:hypothetical protein